jgi:acetyl-CoA acyltransferase
MMSAVIAGWARTPFAFAGKGALSKTRPDDLASIAIRALVERSGVDVSLVEEFLMGCA